MASFFPTKIDHILLISKFSEFEPCLSPSVSDHPLGPATDHRLAYGVLAAISSCCFPPKDRASSDPKELTTVLRESSNPNLRTIRGLRISLHEQALEACVGEENETPFISENPKTLRGNSKGKTQRGQYLDEYRSWPPPQGGSRLGQGGESSAERESRLGAVTQAEVRHAAMIGKRR
ncbi:hypothetical protein SDJN02_16648, partial [Cucurbita argyrosperma subsp. argyrosperma]